MRYLLKSSVFALILTLVSSCSYLKNVKALTNGKIKRKNYVETVHFESRKDLIVVPALLNSDSTLHEFIFDTGAFNSKVEYGLATQLSLKKVAEKNNSTAQGVTRHIDVVRIDSLKMGSTPIFNASAGKLKYDSLSASPCVARNGIIGANIIKLANWKINYDTQLLHFSDAPFTPANSSGALPFERPALSGTPKINLKVNGREVENILFDTGFNGGLVLPMFLADSFASNQCDTILDRSTSGIYGVNLDTLIVKQLDLEVAGFSASVPVSFSSLNKALLGNEFLKHFEVIINYNSNTIYLDQKAPIVVTPGPELLFVPNADGLWEAARTSIATPFKPGDTFVRINGKTPPEVFVDYCDYVMNRNRFFDVKTLLLETETGEQVVFE